MLKGLKFTGVFAFGKENFQSLWNAAPWFQPGVKSFPEDSIIAYSFHCGTLPPFFPPLSITEGHGLIWGRNSALELQIRCLVNSLSLPGQAGYTFYKYLLLGNSSGSPVFRILCFQRRGRKVQSLAGGLRSYTLSYVAKNKNKDNTKSLLKVGICSGLPGWRQDLWRSLNTNLFSDEISLMVDWTYVGWPSQQRAWWTCPESGRNVKFSY